ncbi:hypothetical protein [Massilimicrobiota sp. An134]|uniref:hypothetical protein n=1 Tax=Massilimicrobiota sp. An134 TaxID=1965557 RepID=UPI000B371938|nr:hypothetical protein [Massilimicrobiota sp. An134]OUQ31121.1 hypothetical protein B5E79_00390 [Massilimicrobiota sp. An134]
MIDWTSSMNQTFEYYIVDPSTWKDKNRVKNVRSCSISRETDSDTLGSATFDVVESLGECYIRTYLIATQDKETAKIPLGTHIVQTPSKSFDGKLSTTSLDAFTPLIELKENRPSLGYFIAKNSNIMDMGYRLCVENMRAPVVKTPSSLTLNSDFVSNTDDTWITFISDLIANAKYSLALDEMGRVLFSPIQELDSLQPVWTYNDDNSSILLPEISMNHDLYGMPNVVEVIYSDGYGSRYAKAVNDDPNSPLSTINRGRVITQRITNPSFTGIPTDKQLEEYAEQSLKEFSSVEYTISYSHGYCPVRVGDCVRLNYKRAGFTNIKAKVISQNIKCESGVTVSERAIFTRRLWG